MNFTYQDLLKITNKNYFTAALTSLLFSYFVVFMLGFILPNNDRLYIPMTMTGILIGIQDQYRHNSKHKNQQKKMGLEKNVIS